MDYYELNRIKKVLDEGGDPEPVNWEQVREELDTLLGYQSINESLSLSGRVCTACGRPL